MLGAIFPFAGQTIPDGFLLCDGRAISRNDFVDLFEVIGTTYGAGDGSTTFNLPDMLNRVAVCNASGLSQGTTGGEESHVLTGLELPTHSHAIPSHGHGNDILATTPELAHTVGQAVFKYDTYGGSNDGTVSSSQSKWGYYNTWNAAMTRSTNFAVAAHPATACTMSGGVADCAAFDTESAGQGQAHNNMMPYLALAYIIQYEPDTPPEPTMLYYGTTAVIPVAPSGAYLTGRRG